MLSDPFRKHTTDSNDVEILQSYKSRTALSPQTQASLDYSMLKKTESLIDPQIIHDMIPESDSHIIRDTILTNYDHDMLQIEEGVPDTSNAPFVFYPRINNARGIEEAITILGRNGFQTCASRLTYLKSMIDEEPDGKPMEMNSLRMAASFIIENRQVPNPQITVSHEGLIYLRWQFGPDGVLGMEFLPSGLIRFTAILHNSDSNRRSVNGVMMPSDVMRAIKPFYDKLLQLTTWS